MSETRYIVEYAKSGRATCKLCKMPIAKGELRIGTVTSNPNIAYDMTGWRHPVCFNLPRKYANNMSPDDFCRNVLQDTSDWGDDILPAKIEELAEAIDSPSPRKKKSSRGGNEGNDDESSPAGWIGSIKAAYEKNQDEAVAKPPAKKAKTSTPVVTHAHVEAYAMIKGYKNAELQDLLRWNDQVLTGPKAFLQAKVIDGLVNGRLAHCPVCEEARLKISDENVHKVVCLGAYDEALQRRANCVYSSPVDQAARLEWHTEEPSEEARKMEARIGKAASASTEDPTISLLITTVRAKVGGGEWDLTSTEGIKEAVKTLTQVLLSHNYGLPYTRDGNVKTVDLPRGNGTGDDLKNVHRAVGQVVLMNRDKTVEEMIPILISEFGYVEDKAAKAAKKKAHLEGFVTNPVNAPVCSALSELGELYFKEGNVGLAASYKKAVKALKELNDAITADNAVQLGTPGSPLKIVGVGKVTAEKIHEFVTTGTMQTLERKRRENPASSCRQVRLFP